MRNISPSNQAVFLNRHTPPHIMTLVICAGFAALSLNILLPSLSAMAEAFGTDYTTMQLAISGYAAAAAALQLIIGPLSDLFGRRRVIMVSLVIMIIGTLMCIFAPNVTVLMCGRLLQTAVVAGFVLPRAIVRDTVPLDLAASKIAYITMGMAVAPMMAPGIGGALSDLFSWHATFVLMLILGVSILLLVTFDLGETNKTRAAGITNQFKAWPELLTNRLFWAYAGAATFSSGAFYVYLGGAPFVGSEIFGLPPSALGTRFFLMAFGFICGNFLAGRFSQRIGSIRMMAIGACVSLAGTGSAAILLEIFPDSSFAFFLPTVLVGAGNGITQPNANAGVVSVRPQLAGSASGLGGSISMGTGALLSVVGASIMSVESGITPLLILMAASTTLCLTCAGCVHYLKRGGK